MPEYLTIWRVCRETGFTPTTLYRWISEGVRGVKLKTSMSGKTKVILRSDLEEFLRWRNDGVIRVDDERK